MPRTIPRPPPRRQANPRRGSSAGKLRTGMWQGCARDGAASHEKGAQGIPVRLRKNTMISLFPSHHPPHGRKGRQDDGRRRACAKSARAGRGRVRCLEGPSDWEGTIRQPGGGWRANDRKKWFFVFCGTTAGIPRMQGTRRVTAPPPRGGWRGHGWDVHGWQKTSGWGRDGRSTAGCRRGQATTPCRTQTNQALCRWAMRKQVSTATRSTPPAALAIRSTAAIQEPSSTGRPPPLGGGKCLRTLHSPNISPQSHGHHPHPPNSPKNQKVSNGWKIRADFSNDWKIFFQWLEKMAEIFQ